MNYDSPLSPYETIKMAEEYFEQEVMNSVIKEKPLSKQEAQILEVGVTGGRWEIFWIRIQAYRDIQGITLIQSKSRFGLQQLTFASVVWLLSAPFLYLALANDVYWLIVFPVFLFLLGGTSIVMPIIRMKQTESTLKEVLTRKREIKKKSS